VLVHATDPLDPDSDADGHTDGAEVAAGTDPNDPGSHPDPLPVPSASAPGLALLTAILGLIGLLGARRQRGHRGF
jgi:hypothetical protein